MLNFKAICPDSWKRGLILCLLNIAKHVCSSEDLFNLEVDKLRQMFKLNGYPLYYFNKVLDKFLNSSNNDNDNLDSNDDVEFVCNKNPFHWRSFL